MSQPPTNCKDIKTQIPTIHPQYPHSTTKTTSSWRTHMLWLICCILSDKKTGAIKVLSLQEELLVGHCVAWAKRNLIRIYGVYHNMYQTLRWFEFFCSGQLCQHNIGLIEAINIAQCWHNRLRLHAMLNHNTSSHKLSILCFWIEKQTFN